MSNGDPVTGDRCGMYRAELEMDLKDEMHKNFECFAKEFREEIKTIGRQQNTIIEKIDAKHDKVIYLIIAWVITILYTVIQNAM